MICDDCGQRVGVVDGKVAPHQAGGTGTGMCRGAGKPVDN